MRTRNYVYLSGSKGRVAFTNLEAGRYTLRIVAEASNGERDVETRVVHIM